MEDRKMERLGEVVVMVEEEKGKGEYDMRCVLSTDFDLLARTHCC